MGCATIRANTVVYGRVEVIIMRNVFAKSYWIPLALLLAMVGGLLVPPLLVVDAATLTVTSLADTATGGTLREAIANAAAGDNINFAVSGTIALTSTLTIDKDLTIDGPTNEGNSITIQPASGTPAFTVGGSANNFTVATLKFNGNNAGAGISSTGANVTLTTVEFENMASTSAAAAIDYTGASNQLALNEVFIRNSSGFAGAVYVTGDAALVINNAEIMSNTATNAGYAGGLTINSTYGSDQTLNALAASANTGRANILVINGLLDITNTTIAKGSAAGLEVQAGGVVDLSFVTIADNIGTGIINNGGVDAVDAVSAIVHNNGAGCSGNAVKLVGRSIINGTCTVDTTNPGSSNLVTDPKIVPNNATTPRYYALEGDSPAIDRAVTTNDVDGGIVDKDIQGTSRPQYNAHDLGAYESGLLNPLVITISPNPVNVTEGGSAVNVSISGNVEPVASIDATFTSNSGDCLIDGGAVPVTKAINGGATSFAISANDDSAIEGNETCTISVNIANNGDQRYRNGVVDTITVNVTDNDTVNKPNVVANYTAFDTPYMVEGDSARAAVYTLDNPPSSGVQFTVSEATGQCTVLNGGTIELNGGNWNTGVEVRVQATADATFDTNNVECKLTTNITYTYDSSTTTTVKLAPALTDTTEVTVTLGPDNPQEVLLDRITATLSESQSANFTYSTERPIGAGSTEFYLIYMSVATGATECSLNKNSIRLDESGASDTLTVTVNPDGTVEGARTCTIVSTVDPSSSGTPSISTITINIEADPVTSPSVSLQAPGVAPLLAPPAHILSPTTPIDEGNQYSMELYLAQAATVPQNFSISEEAYAPTDASITSQCEIQDQNGNPMSAFSLQTTVPQPINIVARDDVLSETGAHTCQIVIKRDTDTLYTINLTLSDNDSNRIYSSPVMDPLPVTVLEGTYREVVYFITTNPGTSGAQINFSVPTDHPCNIRDGNNQLINSITLTDTDKSKTVRVYAVSNGQTDASPRLCEIVAALNSVPTNYVGLVPDLDTFVPDVRVNVADSLDDSNNGDATPTPTVSAIEAQATTDAANAAATAAVIPTATATPIPVKSIRPNDDVQRLPVRTGPYLGASLVTVAMRTSDEAVDEESERLLAYEVFAKNNDENGEVTWYLIEANGRRGWVSGRSSTLYLNDVAVESTANVNGEEVQVIAADGLPFEGSVFDTLDGSPDVGVMGTVWRSRSIHRRPSTRAAIIGSVPEGQQVSILNRTREIDYDDWYQIRWNGAVGWINAESTVENPAVTADPDLVRDLVPVR